MFFHTKTCTSIGWKIAQALAEMDGTIDFDNIVSLEQNTTDPYTGEISDFDHGQLIGSNGFRDK